MTNSTSGSSPEGSTSEYMITIPAEHTKAEHKIYSPYELFNLIPADFQRLMPADLIKEPYTYNGVGRVPYQVALEYAVKELKRMAREGGDHIVEAVARVTGNTVEQVKKWASPEKKK